MQKQYLNVREYAEAFGVSIATVYAMCAQGKLRHVRLGTGRGTIRIPLDASDRDVGRDDTPPATKPKPRVIKPRSKLSLPP
jgi:excisionase family DNA binding protein